MQKGDFIRINYIARLESGEIFDLTYEELAKQQKIFNPRVVYRPIPIIVGAGFVVKGVDEALLGLSVGEKKAFDIPPEAGFGQRDPKMVRLVPKKVFRENNIDARPGLVVDFGQLKGRVQSVSAGRIMVDFNNPLAGRTLKYEVEVVEKIEAPDLQVKALLEFYGVEGAQVRISSDKVEIESIPLPIELKNRLNHLILEHVKPPVSAVTYVEVFKREEKGA